MAKSTWKTFQQMYNKLFSIFLCFSITSARLSYPRARRGNATVTFHNVTVPDPYIWTEDIFSDETKTYIRDQDNFSKKYLRSSPRFSELQDFLKNAEATKGYIGLPITTAMQQQRHSISTEHTHSATHAVVQNTEIIGTTRLF